VGQQVTLIQGLGMAVVISVLVLVVSRDARPTVAAGDS
jgi:hypothetical protein